MSAGKRGLLIGALVGCIAAFTNWDGRLIVAASSIGTGAFIGWAIGLFIGRKR